MVYSHSRDSEDLSRLQDPVLEHARKGKQSLCNDEVADKLTASMAQDIAERWQNTIRHNVIEALKACLFLTQSSCAVPGDLTPELYSKVINLSQYLQSGITEKPESAV